MKAAETTKADPVGYHAARYDVAVANLSNRGKIAMRGSDCVKLLNNLSTNDLAKLPDGRGCEIFLLDAKGRILDYATAFKSADAIWLDAEPGRAAGIIKHLDRYVIREDVRFEDATESHSQIAIFGPKAATFIQELFQVDAGGWQNLTEQRIEWQSQSAVVRRFDRGVDATFEILFDRKASAELTERIDGASTSLAKLHQPEVELLRIEAGFPRMGVDIEDGCLAQEIARDQAAISFTKGCYLGQETVARLDALGHVNRKLQGLIFEDDQPVEKGARLFIGEKLVGHVTSSALSPSLKGTIAIAMLRTAGVSPGTVVDIDSSEIRRPTRISAFPLTLS